MLIPLSRIAAGHSAKGDVAICMFETEHISDNFNFVSIISDAQGMVTG